VFFESREIALHAKAELNKASLTPGGRYVDIYDHTDHKFRSTFKLKEHKND